MPLFVVGVGDRLIAFLLACTLAYKFLYPLSLPAFFSFTTVLACIWTSYEYCCKQYWQRHGIPCPPAHIFFGHSLEFRMSGGVIQFDTKNFNKFGHTFGAYLLERRQLYTIEPEMMKRIFIKEFWHFPNRLSLITQDKETRKNFPHNLLRNTLLMLNDDDWKRVRSIVTPAFSTGKLKKLIPTLCHCTDLMCQYMQEEYVDNGKAIPLKDVFGRLILNEIGRAGFSLDFGTFSRNENTENEENPFMYHTKEVFKLQHSKFLTICLTFCPLLLYVMERFLKYDTFVNTSHKFFYDIMTELFEQRKADPKAKDKYNDIFQLLMNALENEEEEEDRTEEAMGGGEGGGGIHVQADIIDNGQMKMTISNTDSANGGGILPRRQTRQKYLSKIELFSQSFILLGAGYETTASVLHFAVYMLALDQRVQDKLREEIQRVLNNNHDNDDELEGEEEEEEGNEGGNNANDNANADGYASRSEIHYEQIKQMEYLQAVVQETMRMFPPAPSMNRECNGDIDVGNGVCFHAGDIVELPIYAIQHWPEYYQESNKFYPERFLAESKGTRHPICFIPFGLGPRSCIGQRFAEFQMHIALALLIGRFKFKPAPSTPEFSDLKLDSTGLLRTRETIYVLAEKCTPPSSAAAANDSGTHSLSGIGKK